jgi:hypothetical protein
MPRGAGKMTGVQTRGRGRTGEAERRRGGEAESRVARERMGRVARGE